MSYIGGSLTVDGIINANAPGPSTGIFIDGTELTLNVASTKGDLDVAGNLTVGGNSVVNTGPQGPPGAVGPRGPAGPETQFVQINADWTATSGPAVILNKPSSVGGSGSTTTQANVALPGWRMADDPNFPGSQALLMTPAGITASADPTWDKQGIAANRKQSFLGYGFMTYEAFRPAYGSSFFGYVGNRDVTEWNTTSPYAYKGTVSTPGVGLGQWLQLNLTEPMTVTSYTLSFDLGNPDDLTKETSAPPTHWTVAGSMDGTNFTVINKQSAQKLSTYATKATTYAVAESSQNYLYLRFVIHNKQFASSSNDSWTVNNLNFKGVATKGTGQTTVASNADWYASSGPQQILNKPLIPPFPRQINWDEPDDGTPNTIANKPKLAAVAYGGDYLLLNGRPALAPVATTGRYQDIRGGVKPPIATGYTRYNVNYVIAHNVGVYSTRAGADSRGTQYQIPHGLPPAGDGTGGRTYVPLVNFAQYNTFDGVGARASGDRGMVLYINKCDDQYIYVWGTQVTGNTGNALYGSTHVANDVQFTWSCYLMRDNRDSVYGAIDM